MLDRSAMRPLDTEDESGEDYSRFLGTEIEAIFLKLSRATLDFQGVAIGVSTAREDGADKPANP